MSLLSALLFLEPVTLLLQTPTAPKLEGTTRTEAVGLLRTTIESRLRTRLEANGYSPVTFLAGEEGLDRPIGAKEAAKIGQVTSERVLVVRLERWEQRNVSHEQMIANPNRPKSETKVHLRLWFVAGGKGDPDLKKDGSAGGPYFGTTNRGELSGSPMAEAESIRQTNRQRLEAIADAVWDGIGFQFPRR